MAPDHIHVHESVKDRFVAECRRVIEERYGRTADAQRNSVDLTRVINQRHTQRIAGLLDDSRQKGARVLTGGEVDVGSCFIAPTLIDQVAPEATIMSEEIFGPVLPILTYRNLDDVVRAINAQPKPLALYIFSKDKVRTRRTIQRVERNGGR